MARPEFDPYFNTCFREESDKPLPEAVEDVQPEAN